MNESAHNKEFNLEEWLRRLVKWIVVDDQVFFVRSSIARTISHI